ncbi:MAG TPA: hypothetical protein VJT09_02790 [Pyrinomonadaceae bacterium]|nr:hypothetical protein [Pyrinomonadaceae bacterium]
MMASRFTRAFQLIALALVFSVAQVYVIGAPVGTNTDPKATDKSSVTLPKVEAEAATEQNASATANPEAAAERMPLTAGTKTVLSRIFSKNNVEARLASSGNVYLTAKANFADTLKPVGKRASAAKPAGEDNDSDDNDDSGRKGTWIAVGVIAAVLTIAVIGLRHDRHDPNEID